MKKISIFAGTILLAGLLGSQVLAHGTGSGSGMGWVGRMVWSMMGGGMGSGMMGGGMGSGMMGQGHDPTMNRQPETPQRLIEEGDARAILKNYLESTRNPNLKLGSIRDVGSSFEAEILTKEDSLVDKLLVDKKSGRIRSAY